MTTKTGLLDQLDRAVATWNELAEAAQQADVHRPGAMGEWTFVDVAGHLNGWRIQSVARMEAAANGTEPSRPPWPQGLDTDDEINDWIHEAYRDRPIEEILAEAQDQWQRLRIATEAVPGPDLITPDRYPWLSGYALGEVIAGACEHLHDEHEADIRAWLSHKES